MGADDVRPDAATLREHVSAITHGDLAYHNPLDPDVVRDLLERVELTPRSAVLDIGCGPGELLVALAEQHGCGGLGIDAAPTQIEQARLRARTRAPRADLVFSAVAAQSHPFTDDAFDLGVCLGSSHAVGGPAAALELLRRVTRPGGHVLLADGFWAIEPSAEYLAALGATVDELPDFGGLLALAPAAGLAVTYACVATDREWDRYEWQLIFNGQRYADEHPAGPLADAVRARVDGARARLAVPGGRRTLGFALLLMRVPG